MRTNSESRLLSGLAGATVLTLIHETARRLHPDAPRMDTLGRRAIASGMEAAGLDPPDEDSLQAAALVGDLATNTLYYSFAGPSLAHGAAIGAVAGIGAVVLPPFMGLGHRPGARTPQTAAMTIAWYTLGGIVAAAAHKALTARESN
jgi:hypothetical protein